MQDPFLEKAEYFIYLRLMYGSGNQSQYNCVSVQAAMNLLSGISRPIKIKYFKARWIRTVSREVQSKPNPVRLAT